MIGLFIVLFLLIAVIVGLAGYILENDNQQESIKTSYENQLRRNTDHAVEIITDLNNTIAEKDKIQKEFDDEVNSLKADLKVLDEENERFRKLHEKAVAERDKALKELNDLKSKEVRKNYTVIHSLLSVVREIDNEIFDEIVDRDNNDEVI